MSYVIVDVGCKAGLLHVSCVFLLSAFVYGSLYVLRACAVVGHAGWCRAWQGQGTVMVLFLRGCCVAAGLNFCSFKACVVCAAPA